MSDTDAMGRLREELERKALESASGWFNSAPEMALALVRVANEVRTSVGFEPMMSEREVVQEFRNLASGTEPDPKARLREASALLRRAGTLLGEAQRSMSDPTGLLMMARGSAQNAATWTDDVLAQDVTR